MKTPLLFIPLLLLSLIAPGKAADGDAPKLINPFATRTANGIRLTATWKPNTIQGKVQATFQVFDGSRTRTVNAVPFVIRGLQRVTVSAEVTGLTRGLDYTWRAIAGQTNGGPITNGDDDPNPLRALVSPGSYSGPVLDNSGTQMGNCVLGINGQGQIQGKIKIYGYERFYVNTQFDPSGVSKGNVYAIASGGTLSAVFTSDEFSDVVHVHVRSVAKGINWTFDVFM